MLSTGTGTSWNYGTESSGEGNRSLESFQHRNKNISYSGPAPHGQLAGLHVWRPEEFDFRDDSCLG